MHRAGPVPVSGLPVPGQCHAVPGRAGPCRACLAWQILDAQRGKAAAEAELKRTQAALERTLGQSRALEAEHKHALAALDADGWKRTVAMVGPDDFVRTAHRFYAGRVSPKVLPLLTAVASALGPLGPPWPSERRG